MLIQLLSKIVTKVIISDDNLGWRIPCYHTYADNLSLTTTWDDKYDTYMLLLEIITVVIFVFVCYHAMLLSEIITFSVILTSEKTIASIVFVFIP
jgi:hypothetical protein